LNLINEREIEYPGQNNTRRETERSFSRNYLREQNSCRVLTLFTENISKKNDSCVSNVNNFKDFCSFEQKDLTKGKNLRLISNCFKFKIQKNKYQKLKTTKSASNRHSIKRNKKSIMSNDKEHSQTIGISSNFRNSKQVLKKKSVLHYQTGGVYRGWTKGNNRDGSGKMTFSNKDQFEGNWRDDKKHGKGIYNYSNRDKYDGSWSMDMKNGYGIYTYADGKEYRGYWKNNMMHGKGIADYLNGNFYDGDFFEDKKEGIGKFTYSSGNVYEGPWVADHKSGKGTFSFKSGIRYVGEFKNDKMNGMGTMIFQNGRIETGIWIDNVKKDIP